MNMNMNMINQEDLLYGLTMIFSQFMQYVNNSVTDNDYSELCWDRTSLTYDAVCDNV
jgi:hypothetical protein